MEHTNSCAKRCNERLYQIRMLRNVQIDRTILEILLHVINRKHLETHASDGKILERIVKKNPENRRS